MPYTKLDKPTSGSPTKKSLADGLIDNDAFFNAILNALNGATVPNGSFELDGDNNQVPDEWDLTLYTNGAGAFDTDAAHGAKSFKLTSIGTGGGYLTSADYFEVTPQVPLLVSWQQKSSVADIRNVVEILYFDASKVALSTVPLYDNSTTNPTSWARQQAVAVHPSGARYAKLRFTGCHSSDAATGNVKFDNVAIESILFQHEFTFGTPGTFVWTCPSNVTAVGVWCYGAGAGGGGGDNGDDPGGGGGGGAFVFKYFAVTPGTEYTMIVGVGGPGGAANTNGTAGTASTFSGGGITTLSAGGGSPGHGDTGGTAGAGGAGGIATGGDVNINGEAGSAKTGIIVSERKGGNGGKAASGFAGGVGSTGVGTSGRGPGAGGAGSRSGSSGAGKDGVVVLKF